MRRAASLLAVVVLLMSMCCIGVSAADTTLIANAHEDLNLRNAIANVQKVNGADALALVTGDSAPSVIYVNASEVPDLTAFFKACVENDVLPVVYVATRADAQNAITARGDADCMDTTFVSGDASVLAFVRDERSQIRTGLTYDLPSEALSSKEADTVRKAVRSAP
ncbi:MAG: hypothetical protein IKV35_02595, partial [Clostridia bacterium]|nr:hypothetical protein [Clostridia bacterium]